MHALRNYRRIYFTFFKKIFVKKRNSLVPCMHWGSCSTPRGWGLRARHRNQLKFSLKGKFNNSDNLLITASASGSLSNIEMDLSISIFIDMMIRRLLFPDYDIKAEMMSPHGIIFSSLLSVLLWLDLATIKGWENNFHISHPHSSVAERRRRTTLERRSSSIAPIGMLAVVRWVFVFRPFTEYLPMRSSIPQSI